MNHKSYIFCLEGGGSHARSCLLDLEGTLLDEHTLQQSANIKHDKSSCLNALMTSLAHFSAQIGLKSAELRERSWFVLCLPDNDAEDNVIWLLEKAGITDECFVSSDAAATLLGAHKNYQSGQGIIIGGTGSIGLGVRDDLAIMRVGGTKSQKYQCSGLHIGINALKSAELSEHAEIVKACSDIADAAGHNGLNVSSPAFLVAKLCPYVIALAKDGNLQAQDIVQMAVGGAVNMVSALCSYDVRHIAFSGSVVLALYDDILTALSEQGIDIVASKLSSDVGLIGAQRIGAEFVYGSEFLKNLNLLHPIDLD